MIDFLLIGAARCGTTSLFQYLQQHPQIVPSRTKELHFFDHQFHAGMEWYSQQFFPSALRGHRYVVGEATPCYLLYPLTPARVYAAFPDVRLIVTLRNPTERAVSHHAHCMYHGYETLPLAEALACEDARIAGEEARLQADPSYYSFSYQHHSYKTRGLYAQQLQRWWTVFPREQVYVTFFEEWRMQPQKTLARMCQFLGLPDHVFDTSKRHNGRERTGHDPAIMDALRHHFYKPNCELEALLGQTTGWNTFSQAGQLYDTSINNSV